MMKASAVVLFGINVYLVIWQTTAQDLSNCPVLYHGIKGHTACISRSPDYISGGVSEEDKKVILEEHNNYRANVDPPACKMLKLYWNDEIAYVAQKWAENCDFNHDKLRSIPGSFKTGQNLAKNPSDWKSTVAGWHSEVKDFIYNVSVPFQKVGHYTQVVWQNSAVIGCGFADCGFKFYVCNYGPAGNIGQVKLPYEKCASRGPLIDCKGKYCKNDGKMDTATCECNCKKVKHIYGPDCSTNCSVKDAYPCNSAFKESACSYANVPPQCPWMCKTCPYLQNYEESPKTTPPPPPPTTTTTTTTTTITTTTTTKIATPKTGEDQSESKTSPKPRTKPSTYWTKEPTSVFPSNRPTFLPDFSGAGRTTNYLVLSTFMVLLVLII